jgi:hypothetical protein
MVKVSEAPDEARRSFTLSFQAKAGSKVQNKVRRSFARAIQAKEDSG